MRGLIRFKLFAEGLKSLAVVVMAFAVAILAIAWASLLIFDRGTGDRTRTIRTSLFTTELETKMDAYVQACQLQTRLAEKLLDQLGSTTTVLAKAYADASRSDMKIANEIGNKLDFHVGTMIAIVASNATMNDIIGNKTKIEDLNNRVAAVKQGFGAAIGQDIIYNRIISQSAVKFTLCENIPQK